MTRPLLPLAVLLLLGTGCATRGAYHRMQAEIATVRTEMIDLRQAQEGAAHDLARAAAERRALQARLAEVAAALKESDAEIARLRARIEAAEGEARAARAQAAAAAAAAASPPPPPAAPPPPAPAPAPAPVVAPPRAPSPRSGGAVSVYKAALTTFRQGEHGQAVLDFLDFIAKYPGHPLVANARYWIGEAYYAQRDYRQALAEFQKVLEVAPASAKAADALLKIGLAHRNLRDHARARESWQRLVRDFPRSEAAPKAKAFLK